jgi:hypothetical protein
MGQTDRMLNGRVTACTTLVLAMAVSGCGTPFEDDADGSPADQVQSAECPESLPGGAVTEVDEGSGRQLVPMSPDPVLLRLCVYGLVPVVEEHGSSPSADPGTVMPQAPVEHTWADADLDAAVAELNAFPAFVDAGDHVCNAALWPGYLLLVEHDDGSVTALTADRSCGLVSDAAGAVRIGLPGVIAES